MKLLNYIAGCLLFANTCYATEVLLINGASPTGGQAVYAKQIANELKTIGLNIDLKTTNLNCALAKNIWESSKIPTIFITATNVEGTTQRNNQSCFIETNKENFLYWLNDAITSFCSAGKKSWNDFLNPNVTHTIVTMSEDTKENFVKELVKYYKLKTRILRIHSSNDMLLMVKSGEVDFVFRDSVHAMPEFKDKCFWNHTQIDTLFPELKHLRSDYIKFNQAMFLMQKGFDEETKWLIRNHVQKIINANAEIKNQIERRGQIISSWQSREEFNNIMNKFFTIYE
jgi:hypothetical protein